MNITLKWIFLVFLLLAALGLGAQDFRSATWGMSLEEVVNLEGGGARIADPVLDGMLLITYEEPFNEQPAQIAFLFYDGRLSSGEIRLVGDLRRVFLKKLTEKYGDPLYWAKYDSWHWSNDRTLLSLSLYQGLTIVAYQSR